MDYRRIQTSLSHIGKIYHKILDGPSQNVLQSAIANIKETKDQYDYAKQNQTRGLVPEPWGYTIHHNQPLRFVPATIPNGIELQVDVYCKILWTDDDMPVTQDIKIRIWSQHNQTIFNSERDSIKIEEELTNPARVYPGRVVSRLHFDKANPNQIGPKYHLQFGGIPEDYELCWHPKKVNVPRLAHPPLELFLTCQIIAANFFWNEYQDIKQKAEWEYELFLYQDLLLYPHYLECFKVIKEKKSLLDSLSIIKNGFL